MHGDAIPFALLSGASLSFLPEKSTWNVLRVELCGNECAGRVPKLQLPLQL